MIRHTFKDVGHACTANALFANGVDLKTRFIENGQDGLLWWNVQFKSRSLQKNLERLVLGKCASLYGEPLEMDGSARPV